MIAARETRKRGGPLAMLGVLLTVWIMGRAVLWESPFPLSALDVPSVEELFAVKPLDTPRLAASDGEDVTVKSLLRSEAPQRRAGFVPAESGIGYIAPMQSAAAPSGEYYSVAAGHQFLMAAAFRVDWSSSGAATPQAQRRASERGVSPTVPAFAADPQELDGWSLDAFAFYRAGSNSASISQGRVPVYGASQAGANLQYRFSPRSLHDPRVFVRAYRALVSDGESEAAAGVSARPIGIVPVRVAAELRVTDNGFGTEVRPAVFAVTELPPVNLPLGTQFEAYGGAGYVGGKADTPFVDGQMAVTREFVQFRGGSSQAMRLSLGAAAWGGAQEDASRLDVGPTMRVDLTIGEVPARISLDWRERVAGDAAPDSGIAATISTRF